MRYEDVSAVLVTRGDVDLRPILGSLQYGEVVVWNNLHRVNMGAFGRFLAIEETRKPVIYIQDDDCLVPESAHAALLEAYSPYDMIVNMPAGHGLGHPGLDLMGWGSLIRRDMPARAFVEYARCGYVVSGEEFFNVGADIVCSVMTLSRRLDLGHIDLPHAHAKNRTHLRPNYEALKQKYYEQAQAALLHGLRYSY
jgi:hypothetical protein